MDVKTVCLGMLTDGPASGYDMKKCFESSFGHFFPAGYGSIYPALATLARNGLVEFEEIPQEGKPDRKVYSITEKGRRALIEGIADSSASHKIRSEFLATLWFAHLMDGDQVHVPTVAEVAAVPPLVQTAVPVEAPATWWSTRARQSARCRWRSG